MLYKKINNTELNPSCICLGTTEIGTVMDRTESFRMLDFFMDRGGNFIDSAHVYGDMASKEKSMSEKTIGRWLKERNNRDKVIIATKGGHPSLSSMNVPRLSKAEIIKDLDESLEYMGVDYIDLYWLHRDDPAREVSELAGVLDELVKAGKIRYYGLSNWKLPRFREAVQYSEEKGIAPPVGSQILWSLAEPDMTAVGDPTIAAMDAATWEFHLKTSIAVIPYTSQARGFFTKLKDGDAHQLQEWVRAIYYTEKNLARLEKVKKISGELGSTVEAVVLGYLICQPFTTIPVISSRNLEQLTASLEAADLELPAGIIEYLEKP